jgi:hypothetical protein
MEEYDWKRNDRRKNMEESDWKKRTGRIIRKGGPGWDWKKRTRSGTWKKVAGRIIRKVGTGREMAGKRTWKKVADGRKWP